MSQLVVPIRDRRRRKRILTLKNFGFFAIAMVVLFGGLTIWSETRRKSESDGYGRLFGKQVSRPNEVAQPKFDIIKEAPVADQTAPDPTLVEPSVRAQYLGADVVGEQHPDDRGVIVATSTAATVVVAPSTIRTASGKGVAIVGGTDGVAVVKTADPHRPTLSGGIFKQQ